MEQASGARSAGAAPTLGVVSGATMLVLIVFTVPLTTLGPTARALGAGPGAQAWLMSAMPLGAATGLLVSGVLGDKHGRRLVFLGGLLVMAAASVAGGLASTDWMLILARIVQGIGGAAVLACGLGLIGRVFPEPRARSRAAAVWAAGLGAGVAVGPILAAALTAMGGWTASYWADAVFSVLLCLGGLAILPKHELRHGRRVDWPGAGLLMAGLAMVLSGLTELRLGWTSPVAWGLFGAGVAILAGFVLFEGRRADPILDPSLFKGGDFTGATVAAFASGAGILALMTLVPMLVGQRMQVEALDAAFLLCAWSATSVLTALGARWLPETVSSRGVLVGGLLACAAAQLMLLGLPPEGAFPRMVGALLIAGMANGLLNAALGRQAVATVPPERAAMGSGANNTARYLGSAIGITLGAVMIAHGAEVGGAAGLIAGWNEAVLITAGFSILGALAVVVARDR